MRTLAWAALPFAAACFLAEYLLPVEGLPYFAAALAVCGAAGLLLRGDGRRRFLLACLFAAAGFAWFWGRWQLCAAPAQAADGRETTVQARVTEEPESWSGGVKVQVRLTGGDVPAVGAMLYLTGDAPALEPGDQLEAAVRLRFAGSAGGEETSYYLSRGVYLLGYGEAPAAATGRWRFSWLYFPQRFCAALKDVCDRVFPADAAPLVKALMTGDKQDLKADRQTYSDLRGANMLHTVAVSGMHLFFLVAFLQLLFGRGRKTSLACLPLILLFTLMTGATASVVRAAVMQALLLAGPILDRESDGVTSLSAALALLLLFNPNAAGDWGLQLSFACEAGLLLLLPGMMDWCRKRLPMERRIVRFSAESICCTLAATAFSLPLSAGYFGAVSLLGWLAGLLTLFVLEIVFCAGYLLCLTGLFLPGAAAAGAWAAAWLVRYCEAVFRGIASVPYACLYTQNALAGWWLALVYVLFGAAWLLRRRTGGMRPLLPASLAVISLCALLLTQSARYRAQEGALTALDVGQGQSVALLSSDAAVLVDCGGSYGTDAGNEAADYLLSCGRSAVDLLVLTHLHEDHANGVAQLMSRMTVERLVYPGDAEPDDAMLAEVLDAAKRTGTEVCAVETQSLARVGDLTLTLYTPQAGTEENERGLVVRAELYGQAALIMGDAGAGAELALVAAGGAEPAEVLVAGHHGSGTSSSALFLSCVRPETAVISVGSGNRYGLPSEAALERLETYCGQIERTDTEGTVTVPLGGN